MTLDNLQLALKLNNEILLAKIKDLNDIISSITGTDLTDIKQEIKDLNALLENTKENIDSLNTTTITEINQRLDNIDTALDNIQNTSIPDLDKRIKDNLNVIKELTKSFSDLSSTLDTHIKNAGIHITQDNKDILDKLSDISGTLNYNGTPIQTEIQISQESGNALEEKDDGLYVNNSNEKIGNLEELLTTNKDTLVNALNEVFQYGCDFKEAIANAITAKDGTVVIVNPKTATKDDFILAINKISSSGTNITGGNASMIICCDSDVSNSELIYSNSTSDLTITKHTDKLDNSEYIGLNFILNTSNGSYTEIFETSSISNIMYGKYSMIIRLKTSTLSSDSIMKINIMGENGTIIYSTEIKGSWFNEVDTYEIFGITFEIKEQNHKNLRIIIYSGNAIGVNIDFDYIMINNVFTSIGSI